MAPIRDTTLDYHINKRTLDPLELSIIEEATNSAMEWYQTRTRHTLEIIRDRAGRDDVPLDAKLFQHLQLEATNLFHNTLHTPTERDSDNVTNALDRMIASIYAIKCILAEEQIKAMMR